jgi:hypothetical protein
MARYQICGKVSEATRVMRQPSRKGVAAARTVHLLEHIKYGLNLSFGEKRLLRSRIPA